MNVLPIKKHEWVEIVLTAGQTVTRVYLPDIANIRNSHLRGLELFNSLYMTSGMTGLPLVTNVILNRAWLTLQLYNGKQFVNNRPVQRFYPDSDLAGNNSTKNPRDFVGQKVNYPKSYIDFVPAFTPAVDSVICMSIYYQDSEKIENQDMKAEFTQRS